VHDGREPPHHRPTRFHDDQDIQDRIEAIELAEQRLRADEAAQAGEGDEALLAADRARLAELRVELDQLWDLLRRRRALRPRARTPTTRRCATPAPWRATSADRVAPDCGDGGALRGCRRSHSSVGGDHADDPGVVRRFT
jgi:hypothetical protein